jgi:hypothetical protein
MDITTDLSDFGIIDRKQLIMILEAWNTYGLPADLGDWPVAPAMDKDTGNVYLLNSYGDLVSNNGDKLEMVVMCGNCACHGFADEIQLNINGCNECSASKEA